MGEQLHRVAAIAARLDMHRVSVYRLIHSGDIEALEVSRKGARKPSFRISESALQKFLAGHGMGRPA